MTLMILEIFGLGIFIGAVITFVILLFVFDKIDWFIKKLMR